MIAPDFAMVDQHVARNPVARAVARARLMQATRDFLLRLHLLPDGAEVAADADTAARVLAVALSIMDAAGQEGTPDYRVMKGGMSTLCDIANLRCVWRTADVTAIDSALQRAVQVYQSATAQQVQLAHMRVAGMREKAAA